MSRKRSKVSSRRRLKGKLSRKLTYYPLLRMLLFKPWFRAAFLCFVLLIIFLSLFLPKIWISSPDGFLPVVKVSGLDLVQAWSLERSAKKAAAEGRWSDANYSWAAAIANNSADARLFRGFFTLTLETERPDPIWLRTALGYTFWFLRLSGTNDVNLRIVTDLYQKFGNYDLVLHVLEPRREHLNEIQGASFTKALFNQGRIDDFAVEIKKVKKDLQTDPELPLYLAAYQVGWGTPEEVVDGRQKLNEALAEGPFQTLANRLQLVISTSRRDFVSYEKAFHNLVDRREDRLPYHTTYWLMLQENGRKEEAVELALGFNLLPLSAREAILLADAFGKLGLTPEADQAWNRALKQYSVSEQIWVGYAAFLEANKDWNNLRNLAVLMRQDDGVRDTLEGFSYFLEGMAEMNLNRRVAAEALFRKVPGSDFQDPEWALFAGTSMLNYGFDEFAKELFLAFEDKLQKKSDFWTTLLEAAYKTKDNDLVLRTAEKIYTEAPNDARFANNYAAALLISRVKPEVAVRLTYQILSAAPNSSIARINHALSLLLNHRAEEARNLISRLYPAGLSPLELHSFHFAWFEIYFENGQYENALKALEQLDAKLLFPNQEHWIKERRKEIEAKSGQTVGV